MVRLSSSWAGTSVIISPRPLDAGDADDDFNGLLAFGDGDGFSGRIPGNFCTGDRRDRPAGGPGPVLP